MNITCKTVLKQGLKRTAPSNGAIWDEFSEQHQSNKKEPYLMPNQHSFNGNKMQV